MAFNGFLFLLVLSLLFSLAILCFLCWLHHGPVPSKAAAKMRSRLPRQLKPRCSDDCPACRLASTPSSGMASMAVPSGFRHFGVRRAAPPSVLDATRPYIA